MNTFIFFLKFNSYNVYIMKRISQIPFSCIPLFAWIKEQLFLKLADALPLHKER